MRLKLPWQRIKGVTKAVPPSGRVLEPRPMPEMASSRPEERAPKEETLRGAEILQTSNVETVELGALAKLPPFRPVVISLVRLFDRSDVKVPEIASLVESDPSMASEILGVVNSPLFGFSRTVLTPAHAITLLGVDRIRSLAATLAMRSLMQGGPRTPVVRRFWVHCLASATLCKSFAPAYKVEPELGHVAGLMHDLGRSGLLAAHQEEYARLAFAAHESTAQILADEQEMFGMTHCYAGTLLAKAWNLPVPLQEVVGHHHDKNSDRPVVALVQLCCRLADDFMYQSIHRSDIQKPTQTIEQYAPEAIRERLVGDMAAATAAIDTAIKALDF